MSVYILERTLSPVRPETCFLLFIFSQGNELSFTCFAHHENATRTSVSAKFPGLPVVVVLQNK